MLHSVHSYNIILVLINTAASTGFYWGQAEVIVPTRKW